MKKIASTVLLAVSLTTLPAFAQFQPGQMVYFKYHGETREGRVKKEDGYGGVIVEYRDALDGQWKGYTATHMPDQLSTTPPADYNPKGYGNVDGAMQPVKGGNQIPAQNFVPNQAVVPNNQNIPTVQPQGNAWKPVQQNPQPNQQAHPQGQLPTAHGAPLSKEDILGFLRQAFGKDDADGVEWNHRVKTYEQLDRMIKDRGVNFKYEIVGDFANKIAKHLVPTNIVWDMLKNQGAPTTQNWYYGNWKTSHEGAATAYKKGNDVWEKQFFGKAGVLTINSNGTYEWNTGVQHKKGQWRQATRQELDKQDRGGDGITLLNAVNGVDWLVTKDDLQTGDSIKIGNLTGLMHEERGGRM